MCDGDAFRQFGLQFVEQGVDVVHDLRGVRTGRLEDHRADARMAVGVTFVSVGFAAQFDVGDVLQTQERAVGLREQHDFTELFGRLVASAVFHRVLERVLGVLAQRTGRRLDVLFGQRRRHVRRDELVLGHYVGLQPDAHRVVGAEGEHLADAADTLDTRLDVDLQVVRQEGLVVGVVGAVQREDLDHRGLAFHGRHTDLRDLGRKLAGGARHFVLHVDGRHVGVGSLAEIDRHGGAADGCAGGHVGHVLHTVDGLFERYDDRLLNRFGAGSRIGGAHHDRRGRDVGILLDGQCRQTDQTGDYDYD